MPPITPAIARALSDEPRADHVSTLLIDMMATPVTNPDIKALINRLKTICIYVLLMAKLYHLR